MSAPPRGGKVGWSVHLYTTPGYVTACERDANRVRGTWQRDQVTCRKCLKIMETLND